MTTGVLKDSTSENSKCFFFLLFLFIFFKWEHKLIHFSIFFSGQVICTLMCWLSGHFIIVCSAGQKGKVSWHQQVLISTQAKHSPLYLACEYPTSSSSSGESPDPTIKKNRNCSKKSHLVWMNISKHGFGTVHARGAIRTQSQEWKLLWPFMKGQGTSQSEPGWAEIARANQNEPPTGFGVTTCQLKFWTRDRKSTSLWEDANVYDSHARGDAVKCV